LRKLIAYLVIPLLLLIPGLLFAQSNDRYEKLGERLDSLSVIGIPGLNDLVDITITNSSLQSFLAGLGRAHRLNILVEPGLDQPVSINFTNEKVKSVLLFVSKKYNLNVEFTGGIMSFSKYKEDLPIVVAPAKQPDIKLNIDKTITVDFQSDTLSTIAKQLTRLTGINIIVEPELRGKLVNGYFQNQSLVSLVDKLSIANGFEYSRNPDSSFLFQKYNELTNSNDLKGGKSSIASKNRNLNNNQKPYTIKLSRNSEGEQVIAIEALNQPLSDIIKDVSDQLGKSYVMLTEVQGNVTMSISNVTYEELLTNLLKATSYSFKRDNDIYLLGERQKEGLRQTKVVQLQYRTVTDVIAAIPKELTQGLQVTPFPELNSIILSGSGPNLEETQTFLKAIDKTVPVITIELMILEVTRSREVAAGIEAGLSQTPPANAGTVLPGVNLTLNSAVINDMLGRFGLTNLGRLAPQFYINIQAMETNGFLDIQSTPKLSTLNGHKATLNIGQTSYYLEQNQNVVGVQNPQTIVTNTYKPVNADFTIDIEPIVSGNEHVTLDISVNQSDFTARIAPNAPPGQTNRKFQSLIRVRNEEVILLGGLEKVIKEDTGKGVPGVARIPVLKWLFGKRTKRKEKSKLLILIKPTISY
jgi:type IV pilus assembly protein PilQ